MIRLGTRLLQAALACACLASPVLSQTRPLAVADITRLEAFGRASISPDGRWAVWERRGAYDTAPRYDFGPRSVWAIQDLWVTDLNRLGGAPERLLPGEGVGLLRGTWSPSGRWMTVWRFGDGRLEVGIASPRDRTVQWTGLTPEMPSTGSAVEWISDDKVLLMIRPDGSLPWLLRYFGAAQSRSAGDWSRAAAGQTPSRTRIDTEAGIVTPELRPSDQGLVLLTVSTGEMRTLARGRLEDFAVAPDGRRIALVTAAGLSPIAPGRFQQAGVPERQRLSLISLDGQAREPLESDMDVAPHLLRWSADSSELLVWARQDGTRWSDGDLLRISADGQASLVGRGALDPLAEGADIDTLRGVRADWLGRTPVLHARAPGSDRFDWFALGNDVPPRNLTAELLFPPQRLAAVSQDALYFVGDGGVWVAHRNGTRRLTPASTVLGEVAISDIEKPFRLKVNDAPHQSWVAAVDAGGGPVVVQADGSLAVPGGAADAVRGSDRPRVLAVSGQATLSLSHAGVVETLMVGTNGHSIEAGQTNAGARDVALPRTVRIEHRDARGRETFSNLFLPAGVPLSNVRGVIVEVYPGSVDTGEWGGPFNLIYGMRPQVLAGAGYAVLSPSIPIDGPDATTPAFLARSVDLSVDATLADVPGLPHDRIAIIGHSFGGYAALAIATQSSRYQSYVSWAGLSDMFGAWGEFVPVSGIAPEEGHMLRQSIGWVEVGQADLDGPPWSDPEAYIASSPLLAADRITAPLLLITADQDFVPMSQSERMFSAMYRTEGRARLVTYRGEEHMIWSPANIRDVYGQVLDWLNLTLADGATALSVPAASPTPAPSPRMQPQR